MLEVENLHAGYDGMPVLHGVDFHIEESEVVSIVGANGVGKSTTVNTISGLVPIMKGIIQFQGERIDGLPPHEIVQRGLIQVPETRELFGEMTVEENLLLGSQTENAKENRMDRLEWVTDLFPRLNERMNQTARTMSGGEQQMLTLARALMGMPDLLIFDEPSVGLAPQILSDLFDTVKEIHDAGVTIIIIEQNISKALELADRGYVMENGEITNHGHASDLLDDETVREAYLGM